MPHPRGYPVNREELEELCGDDAERNRLQKVRALTSAPQRSLPFLFGE